MFICDCCGLCCKNLNKSDLYADLDRGDGICSFFNEENNLCNIYEKRPLKCNVDKLYDACFKENMTREEYYKVNYEACEMLKNGN